MNYLARKQVRHTSWVAKVTPTDRPISQSVSKNILVAFYVEPLSKTGYWCGVCHGFICAIFRNLPAAHGRCSTW